MNVKSLTLTILFWTCATIVGGLLCLAWECPELFPLVGLGVALLETWAYFAGPSAGELSAKRKSRLTLVSNDAVRSQDQSKAA